MNTKPSWFPEIELIITGDETLPETMILPSTSSECPDPILTVVPGEIERTSLESTRYPSGRMTFPDQTVVVLDSEDETRLEHDTKMSKITIANAILGL